jgi:hypothetical protein
MASALDENIITGYDRKELRMQFEREMDIL